MSRDEFVRVVGPVFEHSPWIADRAWEMRPFESADQLHATLCDVVRNASISDQLSLIRAHPDLVGRAVLTAESRGEQAAAGLIDLSTEEAAQFDRYNRDYNERYGFPFVICARLNKKEAILEAFPQRLLNDDAAERATALGEIEKIAAFRIQDLVTS